MLIHYNLKDFKPENLILYLENEISCLSYMLGAYLISSFNYMYMVIEVT